MGLSCGPARSEQAFRAPCARNGRINNGLVTGSVTQKSLATEFAKGSDRAAVILSAAMLDDLLRDVLVARLVPNTSASDPLFDGANAPLSTFSSRIDACYRLGLISAKLARDLHLIRTLRNDFAHNIKGCTFTEFAAKNRVEELMRSHGFFDRSPKWAKKQGERSTRDEFLTTAQMIIIELEDLLSAKAFTSAPEEWIYSAKMSDEDRS